MGKETSGLGSNWRVRVIVRMTSSGGDSDVASVTSPPEALKSDPPPPKHGQLSQSTRTTTGDCYPF